MWRYLTYRSGDQHRTKCYPNTSTVKANTYFPVMSTAWAPYLSIKPHPCPKNPIRRILPKTASTFTLTSQNGHSRLSKPAQLRHRCHHRNARVFLLCDLPIDVLDFSFPFNSRVNPIRSSSDRVWWRYCPVVSVCCLPEWLQCIAQRSGKRARFHMVCRSVPSMDRSTSDDRFSLSSPTVATTWIRIGFHRDRCWKPFRRLSQRREYWDVSRSVFSPIFVRGPVGLGANHSHISGAAPRSLPTGRCIRPTGAHQPIRLCSLHFAPSWENWNSPVLAAESPRHVLGFDIQPRGVFQSGRAGSNSLHVLMASCGQPWAITRLRPTQVKPFICCPMLEALPGTVWINLWPSLAWLNPHRGSLLHADDTVFDLFLASYSCPLPLFLSLVVLHVF